MALQVKSIYTHTLHWLFVASHLSAATPNLKKKVAASVNLQILMCANQLRTISDRGINIFQDNTTN